MSNINIKRIAFVVHPDKKAELIEWSYFNKSLLQQHEVIATGEAANILKGTLNKPVKTYITGPAGGFQELCTLISDGSTDAVILFWSSDETPMQKKNIRAVIHAALEADIIIANNKTTADFIITSPLMQETTNASLGDGEAETFTSVEELKKNNAA